jgi:holo-[acyl-carrier protein] synthase
MNQNHIGIDIIEIRRIREAINRWGEHFLSRIFTDLEISSYRTKPESLAVRFAGKEAAIKALSPAAGEIGWRDIEILSESSGKPVIHLHGNARQLAAGAGLRALEISLSHSREYAVALVIGVRED